jgi:3-polyprenyl-4-hydroxybenzoate decarboxylase
MYFKPKTIDEYVNAFVDKLLSVIGVKNIQGWRSEELV